MGRPANKEIKAQIRGAAWRQFGEVGFTDTTYSSIAEECGISRNLAQYHFAEKRLLAVSLMEHVLDRCQNALGLSDEQISGSFQNVYELGAVFFEYMLKNYRQFLRDILESRQLTEDVLAFNLAWASTRLKGTGSCNVDDDNFEEAVVMHMGGFYEYLYFCLSSDRSLDVPRCLQVALEGFRRTTCILEPSEEERLVVTLRINDALRALIETS